MHKPRTIIITLLGKEYRILCPEEKENALLKAAQHVDTHMQNIRQSGRVVGTDHIAVMTALNIADELLNSIPSKASTELAILGKSFAHYLL